MHKKADQYFMSYLEYGVTDWQSIVIQNISYPDGSYKDLSLGLMQQIYKHEYINIRGGVSYMFGPGQSNFDEGIFYSVYANGKIYGDFGYIFQLGVSHIFDSKPEWSKAAYLTYNVMDELALYICATSELVHFDDSIDFSFGGWYVLFEYKYGFEWATFYFDVGNVAEHEEGIRLSVGIDILY